MRPRILSGAFRSRSSAPFDDQQARISQKLIALISQSFVGQRLLRKISTRLTRAEMAARRWRTRLRVRIATQDHFIASHSTSIGDMMSPMISTVALPRMPNAHWLRSGAVCGPSSATGSTILGDHDNAFAGARDLIHQCEAFGLELRGFDCLRFESSDIAYDHGHDHGHISDHLAANSSHCVSPAPSRSSPAHPRSACTSRCPAGAPAPSRRPAS